MRASSVCGSFFITISFNIQEPPLRRFLLFLLTDVERSAAGKGDGVGRVEGFQIHLVITYARFHRHYGAEQFTGFAGREQGRGQLVPALLSAQMAHFPDEVVVGPETEPRAEHITDAVAFSLPLEEPPRALQP